MFSRPYAMKIHKPARLSLPGWLTGRCLVAATTDNNGRHIGRSVPRQGRPRQSRNSRLAFERVLLCVFLGLRIDPSQ